MRIALATVGLLACLAADAHAKTKLVVLGIEAVDEGDVASQEKTAAAAKLATDALRGRVSLNAGRFAVPAGPFRELTEVKILNNCLDEATACMTGVGKELGADKLLFGKLEKGKGGYTLTVRLLNVATKTYERSPKSVTMTASEAQNDSAVKDKASQVFAELTGTELTGSLSVKANVETGTVSVGGEPKASLAGGVATVSDLPEGSLLVSVEAKGYKLAEQQVTIESGKTARVEFTLEVDAGGGDVVTPPPGGGDKGGRPGAGWRTAGWIAAGVAVIGIGVGFYEMSRIPNLEKDAEDELRAAGMMGTPCSSGVTRTKACDKGDDAEKFQIAGFLGGGLFGLAAAGMLYKGYTAEDRPAQEESARRGRRLVVAPTVTPGGVGAALRFEF